MKLHFESLNLFLFLGSLILSISSCSPNIPPHEEGKFYYSTETTITYVHSCDNCPYINRSSYEHLISDVSKFYYNPKNWYCDCMKPEHRNEFKDIAEKIKYGIYNNSDEVIIGKWEIDMNCNGNNYGFDRLKLIYNKNANTYKLDSSVGGPSNNEVSVTKINEGWRIEYKKKWDDHYVLLSNGLLTMKNPKYPDASSRCTGTFKEDLLPNK